MSDGSIRVLLVEDNASDVLMLKHHLSEVLGLHFTFEHVERLEEALAFLANQSCDLVLLDLGLPDSQGIETLTRARNQSQSVPIVVLTGLDSEEISLKALQDGAEDYLVKDQVQPSLLRRTIRYAMERHRMEQMAIRAEKLQALGTLAGGIAHDFNNILLAVSGNAKLALEHLGQDNPAYTHVLEIAKAGSRAAALTRKILSFSRQRETNLRPMQLAPVVEEALSLLHPTWPAGFKVHKNFPSNLPLISADASQVHQIIINLTTNAVDALGDQFGHLEICASPIHVNGNAATLSAKLPPGNYVKLSVKDSGPGMDKQTLARAFEPFFTTKTQGRGTGMGLAIVHGIMKSHLGEVTAYSEPGKGTVFNLYFPVSDCATAEVVSEPAFVPEGGGQHILYVDDEEPLVLLITRTLKRLGYRVSGYTNPLEALHALRQDPRTFQAVVTDLSMPQMSGTDFAREVLELCPAMPIVLTTGYIRPQDQELARSTGVKELVLKPDTVEDLGIVLHRLLSGTPPTVG